MSLQLRLVTSYEVGCAQQTAAEGGFVQLVKHNGELKTLMDTIRIACVNAENELALRLAPYLNRSKEAKATLANIFAAPGAVRVNGKSITVTLDPAGTSHEKEAFEAFFKEISRMDLSLPGDPKVRRLCFKVKL